MNLLHLCRQYWPSVGGVERFMAELSARLSARGHTVEVATLNRLWGRPERLPPFEIVAGIPVHRFPFIGNALFFCAPGVIRLFNRFDALHVHNTDFFLDYVALTRAIHRRPFVVSTHGGFFHTPAHSALKWLYFGLLTRGALRAAQAVIPNSAGDERRFAPYARRALRIDNAIDYDRFAGVSRQPVPGRLITVGRLTANKAVGALLETLAVARASRPDLVLVVLGAGALRAELQTQAAQLGVAPAVEWLGEVSDARLQIELGRAEAFVSAAYYEGFGLAALEAMAAGAIPVLNDIEAFRAIIVESQNGFLTQAAQPAAAAQAWLKVLALSAERKQAVSEQARQTAARFDWANAIEKFERIYQQAIS
jgi:alpha-1,3-mannosyltransferase